MRSAIVRAEDVAHLRLAIEREVNSLGSLQEAAQRFCEIFCARFSEFAVLVRVFATLRYDDLPGADRQFIRSSFTSELTVNDNTEVLTLLGTAGVESAWNDRRRSLGHRAIPLFSDAYVAEAPMIARLLDEIGFARLTVAPVKRSIVVTEASGRDGLFYVQDAATTRDDRKRLIIPSTDFVQRYEIGTVFGFGGPYSSRSVFLTAIVFSRAAIAREDAAKLMPLIDDLRNATSELFDVGALFPTPS